MTIHRSLMVLASGSAIRASLLRNAGLTVQAIPAQIDESAIKSAHPGDMPRDLALRLAKAKARDVQRDHPGAVIIGCDQVLDFDGQVLSKPHSRDSAVAQIAALSGRTHRLLSAVCVLHPDALEWSHVGTVTLTMRDLSTTYIDDYVTRNWPGIGDTVGSYKLEEEGARFFTSIEGDYFTVLGLPLLPLLSHLIKHGLIAS